MSLTRSKAVLELGRRLASQLNTDGDLLASWMSHYIAELIDAVDNGPADTRAVAQETCAKAILELWRYRTALPGELRPFADLEPILRTLASLDVEQTDHRYFPHVFRELDNASADQRSSHLLKSAVNIDYVARLLIQWMLRSGAEHAASISEPWVELAAAAGADVDVERAVLRFIRGDGGSENGMRNAAIEERLKKLEAFIALAKLLVEEIRTQVHDSDVETESDVDEETPPST